MLVAAAFPATINNLFGLTEFVKIVPLTLDTTRTTLFNESEIKRFCDESTIMSYGEFNREPDRATSFSEEPLVASVPTILYNVFS